LTNVTSGSGTVTQGWYVALNSNEKVLAEADIFNNAVFFTSFTPTTAATCSNSSGTAKLYSVNLTTGDAALNLATGAVATAGTGALAAAKTIGSGIPSRPEIVITNSGNSGSPYAITGTTNREIVSTQVPSVARKGLLAWREVF
jgi:Tfp pilus tip-associated adhesin PilY1